ncbi:MAG TPA: hypothetical protein VGG20_28230 [Thermoanaerobaculia bacterium]|jgi:hypothetical protein
MNIRKAICFLILMTAVAIQPALAAGPHAPRPVTGADPMLIVDVPAKGVAVEKTIQTTPGDDVGFSIGELFETKACPGGGNATFTWTIFDNCVDGEGIYLRFFDETNDLAFPSFTQVYSIASGHSGVARLSVKRGAKICYGAEPPSQDGSYWGVSLDNSQDCASCCNVVPNSGNLARTVHLICS